MGQIQHKQYGEIKPEAGGDSKHRNQLIIIIASSLHAAAVRKSQKIVLVSLSRYRLPDDIIQD